MAQVQKVLVVGGGVGGLSAATAFAQRGVEVTLIERRPNFEVPGVGLGQPANALRVYEALGVLDQVLDRGFAYDHMAIFDADRRLIAHHDFLLGDERLPAFCALPRADLHDILLGAAKRAGVEIRLGVHVTQLDAGIDNVAVEFSDGGGAVYDLVAGFDGIRSATRLNIVGTMFVPRHSGFGAWRIQTQRPPDVTGMEFMQGIEGKAGAMPISNDKMYLFNIRPEPAGAVFERQNMAALFKERLSQFGGYVADIAAGLNEESDIVYSPIKPMLVPWPWHHKRIVIGGDAAHVVPPHLTQGAAMAVEDALVLVHEVMKDGVSIEESLMQYSQKRYARCAFVHAFSLQWMELEQSIHTPQQMEEARAELALNASNRIAVSDRILNSPIF